MSSICQPPCWLCKDLNSTWTTEEVLLVPLHNTSQWTPASSRLNWQLDGEYSGWAGDRSDPEINRDIEEASTTFTWLNTGKPVMGVVGNTFALPPLLPLRVCFCMVD